uniref:Sorting nexin n=1 Tax=Glossina pallidipes TaxID=7398 RepID=A0A1A9Z4L2_GLOPL
MSSFVRVLYEFAGEAGSTEISISVGEILTVTRTDVGEGWWEGKNSRGEIGLFPAAYVEVMSAADVKQQQQRTTVEAQTAPNRYDQTADEYNDGDEWEDDWDEDNDTYSEIVPHNPSNNQVNSALHSTNDYDNKYLPTIPGDDTSQSLVLNANNNPTTLKKSSMFGKSSDSFILGMGNKDRIPDNELVLIVPLDNLYQWQPSHQHYTVVVASPKKESKFKGMKTFIAYQLTPSFNNISRLVEKFCLIPIPPLPDKQISGRYEEQFVEHRRVQLQEFVDWVCRHPVLSKCEVWYHFLTCTDEKIWKSGKRKAERDTYVGITYCWAISPPEKQLLQSYVDTQMDSCSQFIHAMDTAIRNLLSISNDVVKRYQTQIKKEYQRIGEGLSDLSRALLIDEKRAPSRNGNALSENVARIGDIFSGIGVQFGEQPKLDWIPFSDRLHIYRGILNSFPDILTTHKGAMQKKKDCERLAAEQKMSNTQLAEVNRRVDIVSYAIIAEITHFRFERETHLKQTLKLLIEEQIKFYSSIVSRLEDAYKEIE